MFPSAAYKLNHLFTSDGYEIRVVGGYVRDKLRGIEPKDLDLATTARPEAIIALCDANGLPFSDSGLKHGTVGIILDSSMYEVTTLRIDTETDGRHAAVEFTTDWRKDAARRDFTMNAMSMGFDGTLYDYFDGKNHLDNNRVVFVGDAATRIKEDYLRILRYFRFCGRLGDREGDDDTLNAIAQNAKGLEQISRERVWLEMSKILAGPVQHQLNLMWHLDVLAQIDLPNVTPTDISRAIGVRSASDNPITVLAAMTGDPGIGQAWKMSRHEISLLHWLQSRRAILPSLSYLKEVATGFSPEYAIELAALFGPNETLDAIRSWTVPVFPVLGRDLVDLGMTPGPAIGQMLRQLEQRWKESDYCLSKEQLLASMYVEE